MAAKRRISFTANPTKRKSAPCPRKKALVAPRGERRLVFVPVVFFKERVHKSTSKGISQRAKAQMSCERSRSVSAMGHARAKGEKTNGRQG